MSFKGRQQRMVHLYKQQESFLSFSASPDGMVRNNSAAVLYHDGLYNRSGACAHFQMIVEGVFNEDDFRNFQHEINNADFSKLKYSSTVSIYLDDLHTHSYTMAQQFYLIWWILKQAVKFNLKLNASKCEIMTTEVECLGYSLSPSRRIMSLSQPRAKLIQSWRSVF